MVSSSYGWVEDLTVMTSVVLTIEFIGKARPETRSYPCIHMTKFLRVHHRLRAEDNDH